MGHMLDSVYISVIIYQSDIFPSPKFTFVEVQKEFYFEKI